MEKKNKNGLGQYRGQMLSLTIIHVYAVIIGHQIVNRLRFIVGKRDRPNTFRFLMYRQAAPNSRKTNLASCSSRNVLPDELEQFREADKLTFSEILFVFTTVLL